MADNRAIPDGVVGTRKVPGLVPSLSVFQWNSVVDVLTAEELSAYPNETALSARNAIRQYLVSTGYRNPDIP
ncbi:MAG TPA: hypothetical protein VGR71_11770 [Nitrospira sp.]|nr:hypothetical protein [Nitrospira sp.]